MIKLGSREHIFRRSSPKNNLDENKKWISRIKTSPAKIAPKNLFGQPGNKNSMLTKAFRIHRDGVLTAENKNELAGRCIQSSAKSAAKKARFPSTPGIPKTSFALSVSKKPEPSKLHLKMNLQKLLKIPLRPKLK